MLRDRMLITEENLSSWKVIAVSACFKHMSNQNNDLTEQWLDNYRWVFGSFDIAGNQDEVKQPLTDAEFVTKVKRDTCA